MNVSGATARRLKRLPTDHRVLLRAAVEQGFDVSIGGTNHFTIRDADGNRVAWASGSPRPNRRDFYNLRASLRRAGFVG